MAGAQPSRARQAEDDNGGTLLIVEDEPLLAMQLSQSLKDYGWNVARGRGINRGCERILAHGARPDAAILDVDLGGSPVFRRSRAPCGALACPSSSARAMRIWNIAASSPAVHGVRKPATVLQIVSRRCADVVRT